MPKREPKMSPGAAGRLRIRAEVDGELHEGEGDYRYVGQLTTGMHAFVPAGDDRPIYLHPCEVIRFREQR